MLQTAPFFTDCIEDFLPGRAFWAQAEDGVRIRIGAWNERAEKGTVLLFPGRSEYVEKYAHTAGDMARAGYATLAVDWRGQGLADRFLDNPLIGHVGAFSDYQHDVQAAIAAAAELNLPKPWFLLGHSMGGCIGLRALHEGLPVEASVFSAPMWGLQIAPTKRPVAWALSWSSRYLGTSENLAPSTLEEAYVSVAPFEDNTLTTDPAMWDLMRDQLVKHPELGLAGPSLNWLHGALREMLCLSRMPSPALPCLTYLGGNERIVAKDRIRDRMTAWPGGKLMDVPGAEHEILMEAPDIRQRAYAEIQGFFGAVTTGEPPLGALGDGEVAQKRSA